ncbi:chemotaxis protein CheW [Flagellatimonas centrodinii]|uniref:chemotaxis protein CheW n=1 Tax=Flagellatimonas centrodinii TaxID=2806210 RepID=UPI001FEF8955|nr:chemotaxis protein CheW [Flagellatimonas centrodinii]ULQ45679.1 chemotaxis protein CheW [Flagellatimonas centrodinii]
MDGSSAPLDNNEANAIGAEYLTFCLGAENYGVDILRVQEIRGYDSVTRLPAAPAFIKGVINLRGTIVPVVDMRIKFGLGEPVYDSFTVMVILNVANRVIGMVVDRVSDVVRLRPEDIKDTPEFGSGLDVRYVAGLAERDGQMLIVVDIEKLFKSQEMALFDSAVAG